VKNANRKPTIKELEKRIGMIEIYLQKVINPNLNATMNMFEQYLEYKNDLEPFTERISEKVDEQIKRASKEGQTQPTAGSGTAKTSSKDGKKLQPRSTQQRQRRSATRKGGRRNKR
jgi:4-diphosphocytidyl-2C-methyl-D-erythritol kinase